MQNAANLSKIDKIIIGLCGLGLLFMGYLSYLHFKTTDGSLCNFGAGLSCEIVNKSIYSEVLGVPLSFLGLAYFVTVAALAYKKFIPHAYRAVQGFTMFSLVFGINLSLIEVRDLGTICPFCEASKVLMLVILALAWKADSASERRMPAHWMATAAIVGLLFVGATRYLQAM